MVFFIVKWSYIARIYSPDSAVSSIFVTVEGILGIAPSGRLTAIVGASPLTQGNSIYAASFL